MVLCFPLNSDQLDRIFVAFRNGCRDDRLDYLSRIHLLEVIELRASNWLGCDNLTAYYKAKITAEVNIKLLSSSSSSSSFSSSSSSPPPPPDIVSWLVSKLLGCTFSVRWESGIFKASVTLFCCLHTTFAVVCCNSSLVQYF